MNLQCGNISSWLILFQCCLVQIARASTEVGWSWNSETAQVTSRVVGTAFKCTPIRELLVLRENRSTIDWYWTRVGDGCRAIVRRLCDAARHLIKPQPPKKHEKGSPGWNVLSFWVPKVTISKLQTHELNRYERVFVHTFAPYWTKVYPDNSQHHFPIKHPVLYIRNGLHII